MAANLHRGEPSYRDYTPGSAVSAGDVITIGAFQYIAHRDIAANALGAVACPYGGAAYKVDTDGLQTIADGAAVLVNVATGEIDGTGVHLGYAEGAVASGDGTAIVRHDQHAANV